MIFIDVVLLVTTGNSFTKVSRPISNQNMGIPRNPWII